MGRSEFIKRLQSAAELIASWPIWKRTVLIKSTKPTLDVPREPVKVTSIDDSYDQETLNRMDAMIKAGKYIP